MAASRADERLRAFRDGGVTLSLAPARRGALGRKLAADVPGRLALAGIAMLLLLVSPSTSSAGPRAQSGAVETDPLALTKRRAHLAQVVTPTRVWSQPGDGVRRGRLDTEATWGSGPVRLLVLQSTLDRSGRRWLRVRLPDRPNDRAGWIRADRTRLTTTAWRIVISTGSRTVEARHRDKLVRRFSAVVGAPATPTPKGLFAISERIRQAPGELGPWALHLTAHSSVLDEFGGGEGRVAIHGRAGPLLADPLGSARSHGCIRLDNDALSWLARRAVEGTPVLAQP